MREYDNVVAFYTKHDAFSMHYPCCFKIKNVTFNCGEQAMMYWKAMLFGDHDAAAEIMKQTEPQQMKMIGRRVRGFSETMWKEHSPNCIVLTNLAKYDQNPHLGDMLLATGEKLLVEAAGNRDFLYGCGFWEDDPRITDPSSYTGQNLMGWYQMEVRERLREIRRHAA